MSYGTNLTDAYRQVGVYAGRILKGAKPADLPVVQSTKFELVINAQTARMLGLDRAADAARPRRRGDRMRRGASSSRCSAARRRRGRSRRGRSSRNGCGASECSTHSPLMTRRHRCAMVRSCRGCRSLGWSIGRNVRIDTRWAAGDPGRIRSLAVEIVATGPDVIFTSGFSTIRPLLDATSTLPIVFANVVDPVGAGFVASLARPGGNVTGFASYEFGFPIKWLELLKQIAPGVTRAAVLRDPTISALIGQFAAIQGAAPSFGVEVTPIDVRDGEELQRAVAGFLRGPNDGLIVLGGPRSNAQRDLIAAMIAGHRIPAVYAARYFVTAGGLISYGPDFVDQYRRAAGYVDRILKGEKPANLPVQAPTKHELVINLKTAKALGIDVPASLLARADEVIE